MSRAEERALEAYPKDIEEYVDVNGMVSKVDNHSWHRNIFLKGYHQAEKDLALTWESISTLRELILDIDSEGFWADEKTYCEEVLKRFNERRKL